MTRSNYLPLEDLEEAINYDSLRNLHQNMNNDEEDSELERGRVWTKAQKEKLAKGSGWLSLRFHLISHLPPKPWDLSTKKLCLYFTFYPLSSPFFRILVQTWHFSYLSFFLFTHFLVSPSCQEHLDWLLLEMKPVEKQKRYRKKRPRGPSPHWWGLNRGLVETLIECWEKLQLRQKIFCWDFFI